MKTPFNTDHDPEIGVPLELAPGLRVITAGNAGPMTFTGTQTYLLGETELAVIDPGPADPAHLQAILAACRGQRITHIVVTHSHLDHSPLARDLKVSCGAPIYGFGAANAARSDFMSGIAGQVDLGGQEGIDPQFAPDILLRDCTRLSGREWSLTSIHTPGHLSNHLCFAWDGQDALFSGDHVMGWATTLISPPDGDLSAFMASVRKLQDRTESLYYPGHGAPLPEAHSMLDYLLGHRLGREEQIMAALQERPSTVVELTAALYAEVPRALHRAAARNVLAHVLDLYQRGLVVPEGPFRADARFRLQ